MTSGTLATLGYLEADARQRVDAFLAHPRAYLVDIRLTPYSRWRPQWNRPALAAHYGRRYVSLRGLGNVNHRDRSQPIHLLDPEPHIRHLAQCLTRGCSYLLVCACKDYEQCHRRVVYQQIMLILGEQSPTPAGTISALSLWASTPDAGTTSDTFASTKGMPRETD